jgi:hypothetical protein
MIPPTTLFQPYQVRHLTTTASIILQLLETIKQVIQIGHYFYKLELLRLRLHQLLHQRLRLPQHQLALQLNTYPYAHTYGDADGYAWSGSGVWI